MDPIEYERMYRAEETHWWYSGMEAIASALLERFLPHHHLSLLDAGCGTGAAMNGFLKEYGEVTGCDLSALALRYCQQRGLARLAQATVTQLPFPQNCFDAVTSFDVVYESSVEAPLVAFKEFARVLRPGGLLLLRVPAYDWLRGHHDHAVHTARRFNRRSLSNLIRQSGLRVVHITYANTFLFPLALIKRLAERAVPPKPDSSDLTLGTGVFNGLLRRILAAEAPLAVRAGLPFGLSLIAVALK